METVTEKMRKQLAWQANPHAQLEDVCRLQKQLCDVQRELNIISDKIKAKLASDSTIEIPQQLQSLREFEQDVAEAFEVSIQELVDASNPKRHLFRNDEIKSIVTDIAFENNLSQRAVLAIIKRAGCQYRTSKGRMYGVARTIKEMRAKGRIYR